MANLTLKVMTTRTVWFYLLIFILRIGAFRHKCIRVFMNGKVIAKVKVDGIKTRMVVEVGRLLTDSCVEMNIINKQK